MLNTPKRQINQTPLKDIIQAKINIPKSNQKYFSHSQQKKLNNIFLSQTKTKYIANLKNFQPLFQDERCDNLFNNISLHDSKDGISEKQILHFQSKQKNGHYQFRNWKQFNKKFFSNVQEKTVQILWKILRILNYGEVLIPTGLIFQLSNSLINPNSKAGSLRGVLNKFYARNQIRQRVQNFRQLAHYPSLQSIQSKYMAINPENQLHKTKAAYNKGVHSQHKRGSSSTFKRTMIKQSQKNQQNVFERNYKDASVRSQKLNQYVHSGIMKQMQKCKFKPQIGSYSKKLFQSQHQDLIKPERICHHKQKWKSKNENEQALIVFSSFKAGEVDKSIYQSLLQDVPGARQHISRSKYSTAQKQRVQRYLSKPTLVRNFY